MTHHETPHTGHGAADPHAAGSSAGHDQSPPAAGRTEWEEVKSALDSLGDAMTRWANSVQDDPENRRHARDIKEQFESMGHDMGRALDSAADSDFVKGMGEAAGKAGEAFTGAARTVGREVTPFVATAFRTAAEGIRVAADKIEETSRRREHSAKPTPPVEHVAPPPSADPAVPSEPPAGAEPPAPAPSGTPGGRDEPPM
jgi:hypothetical protein